MPSRRKAQSLWHDMKALNHTYLARELRDAPAINSVSEAAGAMYVLEGSTHGGPYIARMIRAKLQVPESSLSYFSAYGDETAARWNYFKNAFESQAGKINLGLMIAGANETFTTLQDWLHRNS
jgi:heme oxygenase